MRHRLAAIAASVLLAGPVYAQQDVTVRIVPVAPGVHMITANGGNVGVSVGPDGVFLVDDQFAPLTDQLVAAVRTVSDAPIRFVLNTHWHGDHTGGNENLGALGALLVAHDNVRERMSVEQFLERWNRQVPPSPAGALPVVTFARAVTFHLNGDEVAAEHVPHAHTDGDALVHFRRANVIHMGDTYFVGIYPFIDLGSGGSLRGMIAAADRALALANADTKIIPGHGPLSNAAELRAYRDMLAAVRDRVQPLVAAGRTLEQVTAAKPTAAFDAQWGGGFIGADEFVETVYRSLAGAR